MNALYAYAKANKGPLSRVALRYLSGLTAGAGLGGLGPEWLPLVSVGVGVAIEMAYGAAKRQGWAT
jgi:hypothetical protein